MTTGYDDVLDDLFLGCALTAFLQGAVEQRAMPDRRRAYDLYEGDLRARNRPMLSGYPGHHVINVDADN